MCSRDDVEVERRGRVEMQVKFETKLRPDERASEKI